MIKKLFRSRKKTIGGVCQGIADYTGLDVALWRVFFIIAFLCTYFPAALFYILAWIFVPLEPKKEELQNFKSRSNFKN